MWPQIYVNSLDLDSRDLQDFKFKNCKHSFINHQAMIQNPCILRILFHVLNHHRTCAAAAITDTSRTIFCIVLL